MTKHTHKLNLKKILTGSALIVGLSLTATAAQAQTAVDPWTGAIPGSTIYFPANDNLKQIRKMLNNGEIDKAVVFAQQNIKSIETESRSGKTTRLRYDAYNALCISLTAQGSFDKAREACDTAIKESPNRWMAYNSRGSLNYKTENLSAALSDYRLALENSPTTGDIKSILEHNIDLTQNKASQN